MAVLDTRPPRPEYRYGPVVARLTRDEEVYDDNRIGEASGEDPRSR